MSVVVDMPMPKNCAVCPFVTEYSRCVFLGMYAIDEERRADKCPIVCSLPEGHGRLGDLDKLEGVVNMARIRAMRNGEDTNPYWECADLILQAPTIVPAEAERSEKCHA